MTRQRHLRDAEFRVPVYRESRPGGVEAVFAYLAARRDLADAKIVRYFSNVAPGRNGGGCLRALCPVSCPDE